MSNNDDYIDPELEREIQRVARNLKEVIDLCDKLFPSDPGDPPSIPSDAASRNISTARNIANMGLVILRSGDLHSATRSSASAWKIFCYGMMAAVEPGYRLGQKYHDTQSAKGKLSAAARWSSPTQDLVSSIIAKLAVQKDELGDDLPPRELWEPFYADLDSCDLNPRSEGDDKYLYGGDSITYQAFRVQINRLRNRKKGS
jgi:hypothetical protein